jgi:hypothetical protein
LLQRHPHGHLLVTDYAFSDDESFHPLASWDAEALMRLFREHLLARLVEKRAISQALAKGSRLGAIRASQPTSESRSRRAVYRNVCELRRVVAQAGRRGHVQARRATMQLLVETAEAPFS